MKTSLQCKGLILREFVLSEDDFISRSEWESKDNFFSKTKMFLNYKKIEEENQEERNREIIQIISQKFSIALIVDTWTLDIYCTTSDFIPKNEALRSPFLINVERKTLYLTPRLQ